MPFISKVNDEPEKSQYFLGFPKGLNVIQEKTLVNDKSFTMGNNIMLVVDGITRRYGTNKAFDQGGGTKTYGGFGFYKKSTGTRTFLRISASRLQYLNAGVWTQVSAQAYSNLQTRFVQASNRVYMYNGTDPLTYFNGSAITTFNALAALAGLTVAQQGAAGSTAYSYRVAAFNSVGEGAACARVTISNGNATLTTTNYNKVDWTAVPNATGYNIYGRHQTGYGEVYLATVYTNTYNDTGVDSPATSKLAPEDDTTSGIKAKMAIFTGGRQYATGVTEGTTYYPTRLYYSGTVNNIDTFNSSELGGGWVEVYANDGGEIVDIKPFSNGVLVFKTNGIFRFYFTDTGLPALQEITRGLGGVNFEASQAVDNDFMFVGQKENRIAVYTIGFQANYVNQIRTNEASTFIADGLLDVNRTYLNNICSFYYENKFGFAYTRGVNTENDIGYVVDTRFGGWVRWDGDPMKCTQYVVYDDGTTAKLYGCSNSDGYMIEMFRTQRNDSGVAFKSTLGTKFFNFGTFDVDKIFRNPTLWFKYIDGGTIKAEVYTDGISYAGSGNLSSSSGGAGAGIDLPGALIPGSNYSLTVIQAVNADVPRELTLLKMARSIGFYVIDENINTNWLFMGIHIYYSFLEGKPLKTDEKVRIAT